MRALHNIEKSGFRAGEYVGYAGGMVWHIYKTVLNHETQWIARCHHGTGKIAIGVNVMANTLTDLSEALDKFKS